MNDGTVWIIGGAIIISIISVMFYAVLAFFFPEWVGITGKVALDTERSHVEGEEAPKHFTDKL
ncbi:hypothetical protein [Bdellovibrio sp. HCB209]|uniref:hypothetical protein n=1 Tax=Bdellovibrio sp. HCB209 TaxID=3394354 RepID=UPI0039B64FE5